jgi:16S rRNA (cytidine1402-2'-O)-methyltransferase
MLPVLSDTGTSQRLASGLYIVAGPIGNLGDLTPRAADCLRRADLIACEDTRVTAKLLQAAGSDRPMLSYHDHSPERLTARLIERLRTESVALVSDAGTPLISDPGYELVRAARGAQIPVHALPGPCAAIAALTLSGLPTDRFFFAGFLPARAAARRREAALLAGIPATLVFHETGPRLAECLADLGAALGDREAAVARELTKLHEEVVTGPLSALARRYAEAPPRGELVVVVGPPAAGDHGDAQSLDQALAAALRTLRPGPAAASVAAALGLPRAEVYARALQLKAGDGGQ